MTLEEMETRFNEMNQRIQELEDREAIRNVLDQFSNTADTKDMVNQGLLFMEDGKVNQHFGAETNVLDGRAAIVKAFGDYLDTTELTYHFNGQQSVTFTGTNKATAHSYCTVAQILERDGKRYLLTGGSHYIDQFVKVNGEWKIQIRDQYPDYLDQKEL